jgi:3-methyladenine DNA glycosylase/8-oxoguanine DNA glycosylase
MSRGPGDPTMRLRTGTALWRATRTPEGPATLRLEAMPGYDVAATAWGPGAAWALDGVPALLGEGDDPAGFDPRHPLLRDTWRRNPGWRVPRSRQVMEALVPAVLEQKVTGREAWRAWRTLVCRYGEPAPGPVDLLPPGMFVAPTPEAWTVVTAAGSAGRLEALRAAGPAEAARKMRTLPGIGVWTAAEVGQRALGDADAVSVGDFHLASMVGWALVGERVDEDAMLELLEPYAGHRYRAVRMIELAGVRYERHGPRYAGRDYRAM